MVEYKYINENPGYGVIKLSTGEEVFPDSGMEWQVYLEYLVSGGQVESWATPEKERLLTLETIVDDIREYTSIKEREPFYYAPKDASFNLDHSRISKLKLRKSDKKITWYTADTEDNGIKKKKVMFTPEEFSVFSDTVIDKLEELTAIGDGHIEAIQDLYLNAKSSVDDLKGYDYTIGWPNNTKVT